MSKEMLEDPASYFIGVGVEQERQRIIKLLEKKRRDLERLSVYNRAIGDLHNLQSSRAATTQLDNYLALIKGEQK